MTEKMCKDCFEVIPLSEFYTHKQNADGYLNSCKECVRARVSKHRFENRVRIREYDRNRPNKKTRSANANKVYMDRVKSNSAYRNKYNARKSVYKAIKAGLLIRPDKCDSCNTSCRPEAHHDDYEKHLDVSWLCKPCHSSIHSGLPF